jgi:hypothetical protein
MDVSTIKQIGNNGQIERLSELIEAMSNGNFNQKMLSALAVRKLTTNYGKECIPAVPFLFKLLKDEANQVRQNSLNALKEMVKYTNYTEQQVQLLQLHYFFLNIFIFF